VDASYRRTPVSKCVCTRQYPKVPRVDYGNGVKIVDKPVNKDRPVDIWPATITVKDAFKPGGLRMFEGKRNFAQHRRGRRGDLACLEALACLQACACVAPALAARPVASMRAARPSTGLAAVWYRVRPRSNRVSHSVRISINDLYL
jgi:hypothetical protein